MTLIECLDRSPLENVVGALRLHPRQVIFLGAPEQLEAAVPHYRAFFAQKGLKARVSGRTIDPNNLNGMIRTLTQLARENADCVFDVTGGDDRVVMAVGAVFAALKYECPIKVQQFDIHTGEPLDCDGDGLILEGEPAALTVKELVELYGGAIRAGHQEPADERIDKLWELARLDPYAWNRGLTALHLFESRGRQGDEICLRPRDLREQIRDFDLHYRRYEELLSRFSRYGLIDDYSYANTLRYSYREPVVRRWLEKAGNILELKTYREAARLHRGSQPFFDDCRLGVSIDWDQAEEDNHGPAETNNEVDVVAMRGLIPLFISCKNGQVDEEELYKLSTVARRFGGPYARMLLVIAELDDPSEVSRRAFLQRAEEMNINVVTDAASLDEAGWKEAFFKIFEE